MINSSNMVQLKGLVGKNPIVSDAGTDSSYVYFSLGETSPATTGSGDKTRWHDCIAIGHEFTQQLKQLSEGDRLLVQGSLDYDNKVIDGRPSKMAKVFIHDFELLGRKPVGKNITYREMETTSSSPGLTQAH